MKKIILLALMISMVALFPPAWGQPSEEPTTKTITGKLNLDIVGVTYDTLTLVNCFNVDLIGCTVKNLVLVRCWNVDVTESAFVGEGVAVVTDSSIAVAITGCTFSETYSQKLMTIHSAMVTIK
jgi:hypothetical protein